MTHPNETIVTQALSAEYVRVRTKLEGSEKRLDFSRTQIENETALLDELTRDLDALGKALIAAGGVLPPVEPPTAAGSLA